MGLSICIASGKGGVGKTSITAGIGTALAALGKRVICVDADVGLRNLDIALGLQERSIFDFSDVLQGRAKLQTALLGHPGLPGLFLLCAPTSIQANAIDPLAFKRLIQILAKQADFVLVDCMGGLDTGFMIASDACQGGIVVTTLDGMAIRDAALCAERLAEHKPLMLVVNRINPKLVRLKHAGTVDDAMDTIGLPLLGIVPEDEMVIAAQNHNTPVILTTHTGAAVAYVNMAERLLGNQRPIPMRLRKGTVEA